MTATLVLAVPPMPTTLLVLTSPLVLAAIPGRGQTRVIGTEQATVGHELPVTVTIKSPDADLGS